MPGTVDDRLDDEIYNRRIPVAPARASGSLNTMRAAAFSN